MELKGENDECDDDALEESMMMDSADEFDDDALEESMMDSSDECYSGDDCDDEEPEDGMHPKDEIR